MRRVPKAMFSIAGLSTRFACAAKAIYKKMSPIFSRPLIKYAAKEARQAYINHTIPVTSCGKGAIVHHFYAGTDLEQTVAIKGNSQTSTSLTCWILEAPLMPGKRNLLRWHATWCARESQSCHAVMFDSQRYDSGSKTRFIDPNLAVELANGALANQARCFTHPLLQMQPAIATI